MIPPPSLSISRVVVMASKVQSLTQNFQPSKQPRLPSFSDRLQIVQRLLRPRPQRLAFSPTWPFLNRRKLSPPTASRPIDFSVQQRNTGVLSAYVVPRFDSSY